MTIGHVSKAVVGSDGQVIHFCDNVAYTERYVSCSLYLFRIAYEFSVRNWNVLWYISSWDSQPKKKRVKATCDYSKCTPKNCDPQSGANNPGDFTHCVCKRSEITLSIKNELRFLIMAFKQNR